MPEEDFAAEELIIRILHPAIAQPLVGEIVWVLEDRQPRSRPSPGQARRVGREIGGEASQAVKSTTHCAAFCSKSQYSGGAEADASQE